jgi:hypothetical protein
LAEQGKAYFLKLLHKAAMLPVYYHFDWNTVVMHLDRVEKDEGLQMLDVLRNTLAQKQIGIDNSIKEHGTEIPLVGRTIIRQAQLVNDAMIQWLDELIEQYKEENR